jgi:hypothetical protein
MAITCSLYAVRTRPMEPLPIIDSNSVQNDNEKIWYISPKSGGRMLIDIVVNFSHLPENCLF